MAISVVKKWPCFFSGINTSIRRRWWVKIYLFVTALFVILTVGDNVGEAFVVEVTGIIDGRGGHHAVELFLGKSVGLGGEDITEVVLWNGTFSFWVEKFEGVKNNFLRVGSVEFIREHVQENGEVNGGWGFGHHVVEFGALDGHDAERGVGWSKIFLIDETVAVSIDHAEGFLELLDLRLLKHGEHIWGSLCLLLSLCFWHVEIFLEIVG